MVTKTFFLQTQSHFGMSILTSSEKFTRAKFVPAKGIYLSYRITSVILKNLDF